MTDIEYAAAIYRLVFNVEDDGGDANTEGIFNVLANLSERERAVLKGYYRDKKTLVKIGKDLGISKSSVWTALNKAILKLRHSSRSNKMSTERIAANKAATENLDYLRKRIETKYSGDEFINYKPLYNMLCMGICRIIEETATYQQTLTELEILLNEAEDAYLEQLD